MDLPGFKHLEGKDAFCDVLTFSHERIERVESYVVPLTSPAHR